MNRKPFTLGLVLILGVLVLSGCQKGEEITVKAPNVIQGSGNVVTEARAVSSFNRVSLIGSGRVIITQGEEESLTVETDDNLMRYIRTEVKNRTLVLGFADEAKNKSIRPTEPIKFNLHAKQIASLDLSGAGDINAPLLDTDRLEIMISGAGDASIAWLTADEIVVRISGAGNVKLAGQVVEQDIQINGFGNYRAGNLRTQTTKVKVSGAGNATLWVTGTLDVQISGAGNVEYYGRPSVIQNISGVGKLISHGEKASEAPEAQETAAPTTEESAGEQAPFLYATPESQGLSPEALEKLADIVGGYVADESIVGAELVVIKNRRTVLHEVFGWRDRDEGIPMERNTLFNIRSMTKPLIGAAIQLLIDRGELGLDDRASEYLPGFENEKSWEITIEQLLTHRSGLPLTILTTVDEYEDLYSMANAVGERGPEFGPGRKFWYSDAGTDVLGAIVEVVSGISLEAFVRERLLEPLGMDDTFAYIAATQDDPRKERIASLYFGGKGSWSRFWTPDEPFYPFAWSSQTLYSTPLDYARFLAMWMEGGRAGERQLLSSEAVDRTLTPASRMSTLGSDLPMPTGFYNLEAHYGQMSVLYVEKDAMGNAEPVVIGHSGSDGTWAWAWPQLNLMILYFTQSRGNATGMRLEAEIDELLVHPKLAEINAAARERYAPYLGTYVESFGPYQYREFTVLVQNGRLAVQVPEGVVFELEPPDELGWRRFELMPNLSVSFPLDEQGEVTGMKFREGSQVHELAKGSAPQEPHLDVEAVQKYLGFYRDEEAGHDVEVIIHNGHLAFKIPGVEIPLELYPPDEEGWWALRLNPTMTVRFNEDETGRVVSYTARSPEGEAVRPRVPGRDEKSE